MLRLSKLTDYAIVLLTYYSRNPDPSSHTARELAEMSRLPLPTVSKILKALSRAELLVSQRGVHGGYMLNRSPQEITVAEIIRAVEGPIALTECSTQAPSLCEIEACCPVRSNWVKINDAVRGALENLTLTEMTPPAVSCSPESNAHLIKLPSRRG